MDGKFILAAEKAVEKTNVARVQSFKYIQNFKYLKVTDILRKYEALVLSVLFYNCEIWAPLLTEAQFDEIIGTFEMESIRRILQVYSRSPKEILFCELGIIPLKDRIKLKVIEYMIKVKNQPSKWMVNKVLMELKNKNHKYWKYIKSIMELPDVIENVKEGNKNLREAKERICRQSKIILYKK